MRDYFAQMESSRYTELQQEIARLQAEAEGLRKKEVHEVVVKIKAWIKAYGLTAADLGLKTQSGPKGKAAVPPALYQDPKSGKTWSGRGKPPTWITGKNREKFLIATTSDSSTEEQAPVASRKKSPAKKSTEEDGRDGVTCSACMAPPLPVSLRARLSLPVCAGELVAAGRLQGGDLAAGAPGEPVQPRHSGHRVQVTLTHRLCRASTTAEAVGRFAAALEVAVVCLQESLP